MASPPSAANSSPSNRRFPNPHSAAFSFSKVPSPTTRSQPPTSPQGTDAQDEDEDSDVEIYLSALSINNSIEDPMSISLGSIDNSLANNEQYTDPAPADPSLPSSLPSQSQPLPQLPSAPVRQTIPLPPVSDLPSDSRGPSNTTIEPLSTSDSEPATSCTGASSTQNSSETSLETLKTSNVYINGLPPHFPEDQLFALAAPYGAIRSVRTFTRHVRDNESGYGFVLFETVEAAEKCIQSLRRYRNLHPTFSKTVHKIPGTYAHSQLDLHPDDPPTTSDSASSLSTGWDQGEKFSSHSELGDDASFKAKMESLHDPTSTNLYMEGLPLSIDEPTLAALVSPHRISSSRFFQTRLSNPPRIIAFVRFETRAGAEEIIERLHGRMVRGWNDTGSRISVRFADTAEQRELRRTERSTRDDEQSPARLTIAQASLLNLRGQELKSKPLSVPLSQGGTLLPPPPPPSSLPPPPIVLDRPLSAYNYEYSTSPIHSHSPVHTPPFAVDSSLAPGRVVPLAPLSRTQTPVRLHGSPYHAHGALPTPLPPSDVRLPPSMDPAMTALLDSLRNGGVPFNPSTPGANALGAGYGGAGLMGFSDVGHSPAHHAVGLGNTHFNSNLHTLATNPQPNFPGYDVTYGTNRATQARSGYTATEEYIMRAHAESQQQQYDLRQEQQLRLRQEQLLLQQQQQLRHEPQQYQRRRPPALDLVQQQRRRADSDASIAGIGVGVRGYRTQAAAITIPGSGALHARHQNLAVQHDSDVYSPTSVFNSLPSMHEDDFHSTLPDNLRQLHQYQQQQVGESGRTAGANIKHSHNHRIHPAHVNARLSRDHNAPIQQQQQKQQPQFQHAHQQSLHQQQFNQLQQHESQLQSHNQQQPQTPHLCSQAPSPNPNLHHYQQAHLRSMTLPQRRPPSASTQRHYQHNSMSVTVPGSSSLTAQQRTASTNMNTQTNNSNTKNNNGVKNLSGMTASDSKTAGTGADAVDIYGGSVSSELSDGIVSASKDNPPSDSSKHRLQSQHHHSTRVSSLYHHSQQHQNAFDTDYHQHHHHHHHHNQTSPSLNELASPALTTSSSSLELISPALTYSVHTPASTLSPATPFFGSFANANGSQHGHHGTVEHGKLKETAVGVVGMGVTGMGDVNIEFEDRKIMSGSH